MYDAIYKYSLETILDHINICNKRFSEIHTPTDFIATDYGKTLLDAIGENLKIRRLAPGEYRRFGGAVARENHEGFGFDLMVFPRNLENIDVWPLFGKQLAKQYA